MGQLCPICGRPVAESPRYPRYVCADCAARVADAAGQPLAFANEGFSGGFVTTVAGSGEPHRGHDCYIDGRRCRADEARFGGIVIQTR